MSKKPRKKKNKQVEAIEESLETAVQETAEESFEEGGEEIIEEALAAAASHEDEEISEDSVDEDDLSDWDEEDEDSAMAMEAEEADGTDDDLDFNEDEFELERKAPESGGENSYTGTTRRPSLLRFEEALTLEGQIEAVVFASPKALKPDEILEIVQSDDAAYTVEDIEAVLNNLVELYKERNGGFRLEQMKGAYQFQTVPAAAPLMERVFSSRPRPLSRAALETLSIIAYRQPVTRADVEYIRGVDAGSIIKNLLERNMIACVGRKEDSGRPMLFGTTQYFLEVFRLNSIADLPPLSAFQPSPETMSEAMNKLENGEAVDVEGFIADQENRELTDEEEELIQRETEVTEEEELSAGSPDGFVFAAEGEATEEVAEDSELSDEELEESEELDDEDESDEDESEAAMEEREAEEEMTAAAEEAGEVEASEETASEESEPEIEVDRNDPFWELEMMEKKGQGSKSRQLQGASAKDKDDEEEYGTDTHSEVDIPDGTGLKTGGGKMDFRGEDLD